MRRITLLWILVVLLSACGGTSAPSPTPTSGVKPPPTPGETAPPASPTLPPPETVETRVAFDPGAISAQIEEAIPPGSTHRYLLWVMEGQTMSVTLRAANAAGLRVAVLTRGGEPLDAPHVTETAWAGPMPASQDYAIEVSSDADATREYELDIVIPPPEQAEPLTEEQVRNATYTINGETVTLEDGEGEMPPLGPDRRTLSVDHSGIIHIADIDGDGLEDAALVLSEHTDNTTGHFKYLVLVLNREGEPEHVASTMLGDRIVTEGIRSEGDVILIDAIVHGPDDPFCCPSQAMTLRFQWDGEQLVDRTSE